MKTIKLFLILISACMLGGSCSKTDSSNENTNTGTLTIGNNEYPLIHGELLRIEKVSADGPYVGYIYLLSSGYNFGTTITGTGQAIELSIFFNSANDIEPGTYSIITQEPFLTGTFMANIYADLNIWMMSVSSLYKSTSGSLTISKSGSNYELTFEVLADKYNITHADTEPTGDPIASGITIKCTYKGDLKQKYLSK